MSFVLAAGAALPEGDPVPDTGIEDVPFPGMPAPSPSVVAPEPAEGCCGGTDVADTIAHALEVCRQLTDAPDGGEFVFVAPGGRRRTVLVFDTKAPQ